MKPQDGDAANSSIATDHDPDEIDLYRRAAQMLLQYDAACHGNGRSKPTAVWLAQLLYEEHGPFELDWYTWAREPEEWYNGR